MWVLFLERHDFFETLDIFLAVGYILFTRVHSTHYLAQGKKNENL